MAVTPPVMVLFVIWLKPPPVTWMLEPEPGVPLKVFALMTLCDPTSIISAVQLFGPKVQSRTVLPSPWMTT